MTGRVGWVSKGRLAAICLGVLVGGCVDDSNAGVADPTDAKASEPSPPFVGVLEWKGHVISSETDALMHSAPTEEVLWPYEQSGIVAHVPDGVTAVEVAVAWDGPGRFRIHLHSYNNDGAYIGLQSTPEQQPKNPHCIRVPVEDVAPGHWMVMIHSVDALETDFTMQVLTEGVTATLGDERHGHDRVQEVVDGQRREEHVADECSLWNATP